MVYSETVAKRIREQLINIPNVEEQEMMGGLSFMVNGKICVGVIKDELMCRIDPDIYQAAMEKSGCRPMDFIGKPMKGWVMIGEQGIASKNSLND